MDDVVTHKKSKFQIFAPLDAENDIGFKTTILRINKNSMIAAGAMGIIIPINFIIIHMILFNKQLHLDYNDFISSEFFSIYDKLIIIILGAACLLFAKSKSGPVWGRLFIFIFILVAGIAVISDDIGRNDISFTAAWLSLLMLVSTAVPFRGWHTFILCACLIAEFILSVKLAPSTVGARPAEIDSNHLIYLIMVTLVCTLIVEFIYNSRYRQYSSHRALAKTNIKLKATQAQLVQSAKMASLGGLVAGIAHEINNPLGVIKSNTNTISSTLKKVINDQKSAMPTSESNLEKSTEPVKTLLDLTKVTVDASLRIDTVVKALKNFAGLDEADIKSADLHEGLESTIEILPHDPDKKIEIIKNYGELPEISCHPNQINQVFMNLLLNAQDAIESEGTITINTNRNANKVLVQFIDTGCGIAKESLDKIFDPGFTSKGVKVGTGLGLAICYRIIENHRGEIRINSQINRGTEVTVILPAN